MEIKPHERRYKLLRFTMREALRIFIHDNEDLTIVNKIKLPEDVHPVHVYFDPANQCFYFILESESFDPLLEGEQMEVLDTWSEAVKIPVIG